MPAILIVRKYSLIPASKTFLSDLLLTTASIQAIFIEREFPKCILSTWYKSCNCLIIIYFLACPPGYTGRNCFDICPAPYYGLRCGKKCNCVQCHHINGCISAIVIRGNRSWRVHRSICMIHHKFLVSNFIFFLD